MKQLPEQDWSLLHRECSDIMQQVQAQWHQLVAAEEHERQYQRFLSEHAGLFFGDGGTCVTIGQLQLGTKYRPDLVLAHDFRSGGVLYELIELKRPSHTPISNGGSPSQHLNKALKQISDWQAQIEDNCLEVQTRMPARHAADRRCAFTVIIGTRRNTGKWVSQRNRIADRLSNKYRVNIHSYDFLTEKLSKARFVHSSPNHLFGDELILNALANPFSKAFTDKSWRDLVERVRTATSDGLNVFQDHFLTCAGREVVKGMKHNALLDAFMARKRPGQALA